MKEALEKYKPSVKKRNLLFVAGCVWTFAGAILMTRSLLGLIGMTHRLFLDILIGISGGIGFFLILFSRISGKHIHRIKQIPIDNPCFFSFFNFRSYLLMAIMITGGITLRKLNVLKPEVIFTFFLAMGLPLLFSAWRFFYSWFKSKDQV